MSAATSVRRLGPLTLRRPEPIWLVLVGVVVACGLLVALQGASLLSPASVRAIGVSMTALGVVALGQTVVMLVGSFDLSVAWTVSLSAITTAVVMDGQPSRVALAVLAGLGTGALVGIVNGVVITRLRVNPLIATLATSLLLNGTLNARFATQAGSVSGGFRELGYGGVGPLPFSFLLVVLLALAVGVWLRSSRFGHHLYAVGGSPEVARLSGIHADRVVLAAHVVCGVLAAAAGVYLASRLGAADTGVGPRGGYDLESIAVVVLGGTVLGGGRGTVGGTMAGVAVFAVLETTFDVLQVDPFLKTVLEGLIIIAAVASYALRRRTARVPS